MATIKQQFIRITSRIEGFRRAGLAHPCTPCDYPLEAFSDTQLAQLEAEPNLIVQQIEKEIPAASDKQADKNSGKKAGAK